MEKKKKKKKKSARGVDGAGNCIRLTFLRRRRRRSLFSSVRRGGPNPIAPPVGTATWGRAA